MAAPRPDQRNISGDDSDRELEVEREWIARHPLKYNRNRYSDIAMEFEKTFAAVVNIIDECFRKYWEDIDSANENKDINDREDLVFPDPVKTSFAVIDAANVTLFISKHYLDLCRGDKDIALNIFKDPSNHHYGVAGIMIEQIFQYVINSVEFGEFMYRDVRGITSEFYSKNCMTVERFIEKQKSHNMHNSQKPNQINYIFPLRSDETSTGISPTHPYSDQFDKLISDLKEAMIEENFATREEFGETMTKSSTKK